MDFFKFMYFFFSSVVQVIYNFSCHVSYMFVNKYNSMILTSSFLLTQEYGKARWTEYCKHKEKLLAQEHPSLPSEEC